MFAINREEIRTEAEGELARLETQVGLGQKVRVMVVHPHRPPIVDWVGTD